MSALPQVPLVLHLSLVAGGDLWDRSGERLGRVDDLIVRLGGDYPPVSGVLAGVAGRQVYVPGEAIEEIVHGGVRLRAATLDLQRFVRRSDEVLLRKDVLDRQLINVDGARLVRANEIELARVDGWYRVVGVDTGLRGIARRLVPRRLGGSVATGSFLDWASVEPFTGHVPSVRLRVPHPKLARLHPAQLADLVEAASHHEGEEILHAVGGDKELEADVYEELNPQHQVEFVAERSDQEVSELLARMEADDAVDLLGELEHDRRERIVEMLPALLRRRVRVLAGYDPATAGGLMGPDFVCMYSTATKREALERVARSRGNAESLAWIYAMNQDRRLRGAISLPDLLRVPDDDATLAEVAVFMPPTLTPESEVEEIARLMTDYDLTVAPVVNDREMLLGVVTVDDVLELMLPAGWRRRFDVLGGD